MNRDDFCGYYIDEFESITEAWNKRSCEIERMQWERMRTAAAINIQPHVRKRITPRQLVPLPWDKPISEKSAGEQRLSRKERMARFLQLI